MAVLFHVRCREMWCLHKIELYGFISLFVTKRPRHSQNGHVFRLLIATIYHTFVIVAILEMNNLYLYSLHSFCKEHLIYVCASCVLCILSTQTNHWSRPFTGPDSFVLIYKFLKRSHIGSGWPLPMRSVPHYRKSWIRHYKSKDYLFESLI